MDQSINLPSGDLKVYIAKPKGDPKGALIVIHEVWGLVDHIKDVSNRLAAEGYLAGAPDLLSSTIDVENLASMQQDLFNPEKRTAIQPKLREMMAPIQNPEFGAKTTKTVKELFDYLFNLEESKQKVGIIGFCFGGTYSFSLAVNEPKLKLALPFYGHADFSVDELKKVACPIKAFYGQNDEGLISGLDELKSKMKEASVDFEATVYPNCGHAFFNDTNPYAYNKEAATDAWTKVLGFLSKYLA